MIVEDSLLCSGEKVPGWEAARRVLAQTGRALPTTGLSVGSLLTFETFGLLEIAPMVYASG